MKLQRLRSRLFGACWAMLAAALLVLQPLAQARLSPAAAAGLIEVCTTQGSRWVPAEDIGLETPAGAPTSGGHEHCPDCVPTSFAAAPAPEVQAWTPLIRATLRLPTADAPAVRAFRPAAHAQPRAPPAAA